MGVQSTINAGIGAVGAALSLAGKVEKMKKERSILVASTPGAEPTPEGASTSEGASTPGAEPTPEGTSTPGAEPTTDGTFTPGAEPTPDKTLDTINMAKTSLISAQNQRRKTKNGGGVNL